MENLLIK